MSWCANNAHVRGEHCGSCDEPKPSMPTREIGTRHEPQRGPAASAPDWYSVPLDAVKAELGSIHAGAQ